jgi:unsaturated rhamnogalacturonyl hydrolase
VKNFGEPGCRTNDTWGRGNGWALIGLADLLKYLPKDHPKRGDMIGRLRVMMEALAPLQAESGMWRQNLVTAESYEETSGTGLILYALAMGLRNGWLEARFSSMAFNAWRGLVRQVDESGAVHNTCLGTRGNCDDGLEFYLNRLPKIDDVHSFGPVLLSAVELYEYLLQ